MLHTVEGRYEDGRIVMGETPEGLRCARVLVTFLNDVDTRDRLILPLRDQSRSERAACVTALRSRWAARLSTSEEFASAKAKELEIEERPTGGDNG